MIAEFREDRAFQSSLISKSRERDKRTTQVMSARQAVATACWLNSLMLTYILQLIPPTSRFLRTMPAFSLPPMHIQSEILCTSRLRELIERMLQNISWRMNLQSAIIRETFMEQPASAYKSIGRQLHTSGSIMGNDANWRKPLRETMRRTFP